MNKDHSREHAPMPRSPALPFSAEAVAKIAVHVLLTHGSNFKEKLYYDDAADVAVRLLHACQERLDQDATHQEKDRQNDEAWQALRQPRKEEERLKQKYGDPVPFLKGILYITKKRSKGDALPFYRRWLRYYIGTIYDEAERRNFYEQAVPPQPTEANMEARLRQQVAGGFAAAALVHHRESYRRWHEEIDLPDQKNRRKR